MNQNDDLMVRFDLNETTQSHQELPIPGCSASVENGVDFHVNLISNLVSDPIKGEIPDQIEGEFEELIAEPTNISLDAEELATLSDLIVRYDQVIQNLDSLNQQIENLLSEESITGCDS